MPKRAATSATGRSALLSKARMVLTSFGESLAGRPPFRAASASRLQAGHGSLPDQIAFELSERGGQLQAEKVVGARGQLPRRVGHRHILSKRFQQSPQLEQISSGAAK